MTDYRIELAHSTDDDYDTKCPDNSDWRHRLYVDPESRRVSMHEQYGAGTPMHVWHNRAVLLRIPSNAVGSAIRAIVESDECLDLLGALCDLFVETRWDGSNHVGVWQRQPGDDEYHSGRHEIEEQIEALFFEVPTYWSAREYLGPVWGQDEADAVRARLEAGETLEDVAYAMESDAESNDAHLSHSDTVETLEELLSEHPADAEGGAA